MASLKFRHYATENELKGTSTIEAALNAFDVGTIVFIDDTQKQYIITSKSNNVVTYKIYYGKAAVVGVSGSGATRTLTFSDGSEITVKINDVEHATSADTANTAKSVAWNNVTGKPTNFVTTDGTQTITGPKIFTNNVSLQGSTSADSITTEDLIVNGAARFVSGLTGDLKGDVVGNITGNVTGNVTGTLTGDATGNAESATKLQTARNINGTSFNGTASITTAKWGTARTITIADNTNEHTQANNNIDGGANFTLKLPATIKADIIGNASTANSAKSVAWANVTNKPNLVTTDTEQTITGVKTFNNNTTFKNETDVESLTADSLLVTGSARFTNTINGNLKGNVEGNLTGNATTATTATTATEFSANKTIALTGDITGSASSKGGWSVATTIANGAVTNAKLANSKITIAGTAVSLGGSIAASTIGATLTTAAPAAYATNAGNATKAAEATKATKDSDGNDINTTYLKRSGGIMTGTINIGKTTNQDNDVMLRLTEYTNGSYLGGFINYDGANNILNIGVNNNDSGSDKSYDTNAISIIRASARVGIGKTNPTSKLDVDGKVTATGFIGPLTGNVTGNASSATKATNDGAGNTITTTYATKTERSNNDITAASLTTSKLTLTRAAGNITANIPTWNQNTTGTAAKATADANGNNIANTYATKAEVAALPKSMVIKGTLDASHALPTSGMTEGDTYIVGAKGTYNSIACKVGDFFVRTSNSWLRIPAGDEWEYNENTIKAIKVNNAGHADTADTAVSSGTATNADKLDGYHADSFLLKQRIENPETGSTQVGTTPFNVLAYKSAGYPIYDDPEFAAGANNVNIYNNLSGGTVTITRGKAVEDFGLISSGNSSGYVLKITSAGAASPGIGGFYQVFYSRANAVFIQIFRAMIPLGRSIGSASNPTGDNSSDKFITSAEGTGKWEWYARIVHCGSSGSFSAGGHIYLKGDSTTANSPCTWYLSYCNCIDITKGNYDGLRTRYADAAVSATTASTCSGNSATATKATQDSDGNTINTTYLKRSGGTVTGNVTFNSSVTTDSLTTEDLIVNGSARFVSGLTGDLVGNVTGNLTGTASYATNAGSAASAGTATKATQDGNGNIITSTYLPLSGGTMTGNIVQAGSFSRIIKEIKFYDTTGWDRHMMSLTVDGVIKFGIGAFGKYTLSASNNGITYAYLGTGRYDKTNLRIYGTGTSDLKWGNDTVLHAGNFTSYAPSLTGSGASGNWNINITGGQTIPNINSESEISGNYMKAYAGIGDSWTGEISSMSYAAILGIGNPSRGFQLWAMRGDGPSSGRLHYRVGTEDSSAWNTERILIDNEIINRYAPNLSGKGATGTWSINISGSANTATTAGSCTGNSTTATKLETARTIWGQSFNGTGNVSGAISNTGNITPSATKTSDLGSNTLSYRYVYATWVSAPSSSSLSLGAANKTHLTIDTNGNVGIGTTSPTSKLHVAGTGYFTSDISSASNIIAGGYIKGETVKISSGCTLQYDSTQKCVKFVFS